MRIRSRLLLLVFAVLVPALLGAGIAVAYVYGEQQEFHHASMQEATRALALALDRDMARREATLHALASSPSLDRAQFERFHGYAATVAKQSDSAIILSDLEGRQILNTRLPFGTTLPRMLQAEREYRARVGNEITLISDVYVPPAGLGPHSFAIQVPVRRGGEVTHFLTMASFAGQMQKLLAAQPLPQGWHATLVDRQGIVAARSLRPETFVGRPVRKEMAAALAASPEGRREGLTLAGLPGTAFFSRAPVSGWTFVLTVPQSALQDQARRTTLALGTVSLLLLGLGLAAALVVARRISSPVENLREAAQRLGRREPVEAKPSGTLELDAVGEAMADASDRLRESTAELERRVREAVTRFEQSQHALVQAQKLEALGRLTGGIAHDFNNVLQTLTTALHALRKDAPQPQRQLVAACQRAVARGTEQARQLMAFGRVQEVRVATIETALHVSEARNLLGGALPADMSLDYDLAPGLWPVTVDPTQLELALLNLVINARDAMPGGGRVVLRVRNETVATGRPDLPPGDYVVLAVSDTGEGMSEQVMARAMEPFYTTKVVGKGSGMGLPQAYGFARQNAGTLLLESRPGRGTTATLYLPRASQAVTSRSPAGALQRRAVSTGKVLLVEDDDDVRATMSSALRGAGFEIHTASTADEALRRIEGGESYDAVLTDVVMPGALSGIDLATYLRERHPRTGVVVATGYSDRAIDVPGARTLPKPYGVEQAVDALEGAMQEQARTFFRFS